MGLLDSTTEKAYYEGSNHGNYQFTSLENIINQFIIAYVGENKIISKVKRTDVVFHAQRALQELSFDTFKSTKAQENRSACYAPNDFATRLCKLC